MEGLGHGGHGPVRYSLRRSFGHTWSVPVARRLRSVFVPDFDREGFRQGVRDMGLLGVAIAVWGLVTGVAMVKGGMSVSIALVMTFTAFAGSAQLAVLPLLMLRTPLPVVWVTALLVNVRFAIFSAASRDFFTRFPFHQRLFAAYLNGDIGSAVFLKRYADAPVRGTDEQIGYFFGLAAVNWVSWQASSVAGFLLGNLAPTNWGLELAAVLALGAVLIPMLNRFPAVAGVLVTAVLSIVTIRVPLHLGIVISVLIGVAVAVGVDSMTQAPHDEAGSHVPSFSDAQEA